MRMPDPTSLKPHHYMFLSTILLPRATAFSPISKLPHLTRRALSASSIMTDAVDRSFAKGWKMNHTSRFLLLVSRVLSVHSPVD